MGQVGSRQRGSRHAEEGGEGDIEGDAGGSNPAACRNGFELRLDVAAAPRNRGGRGNAPAAMRLFMSPSAERGGGSPAPSPGRRGVPRGTSPGYPASTSKPDLMIGLDPDVEGAAVEDGEVAFASLVAVGPGGEAAFARGDPEVKLDAGLSEELPEVEGSLGGGDLFFGSLSPASTVTLISAELDLLLDPERSSMPSSFLLFLTPLWMAAEEEEDSLLFLPFPVVEVPPLPAGRTRPVSAPIWLHVLASIASGLAFESSCKKANQIRCPSPLLSSHFIIL